MSGPARLIVADDSREMRWLIRSTLRPWSSQIVEAADGRELFWELLRCSRAYAERDVLVVTDICMPVYSGLDVLEVYDELGYHPSTVVVTSFPAERTQTLVARMGGILIPKPFTTSALRHVVEHVWRA